MKWFLDMQTEEYVKVHVQFNEWRDRVLCVSIFS